MTGAPGHGVTLLVDGREHELASVGDDAALRCSADDVAAATGWALEPEGVCRGDVCIRTRDHPGLVVGGLVDVEVLARVLGRPLAADLDERVAVLGDAAVERADALATLRAPDFTLPTLDGFPFTFSSIGPKKKLLFAWASW